MAINVITEDRASGAQVIDGSLKFDSDLNHYLNRTPGSTGNRRTWTWSGWVRFADVDKNDQVLFSAVDGSSYIHFRFMGEDPTDSRSYKLNVQLYNGSTSWNLYTRRVLRDPGSWYHLLLYVDYTQTTAADRTKIYINGELTDQVGVSNSDSASFASQNYDTFANLSGAVNNIGYHSGYGEYSDGQLSNVYLIDGLALGPGYFGFTDPLTNTWRPKKFRAEGTTVNDGTVWSGLASVSSGSFSGSYPATNAFNGTLTSSNRANGDTNGSSIDLDFSGKNIIVKNDIAIWSGKSSMRYSINGEAYVSYSDATEKWKTIPFSGRLLSLKIKHGSDSEQPGFSGLAVDGVTMLDSTTTNLDFGTNGFYLPFDGNSPVGQDQSGNGNNFAPVNFGGSVSLDNPIASGALPILNTTQGGTQASVGVRTDAYANDLVLALPLVGHAIDVSNQINSTSATKTVTVNGDAHASSDRSNFYRGSFEFDGTGDSLTVASSSDLGMGTGDFTIEAWVHPTSLASSDFIVCLSGSDSVFGYNSDGTLNIQLPSSGAPALTQKGPVIVANKWNHFACVRESGALRGYIDGVLAVTVDSATTNMGSSGTATIGDHPSLSREVTGYIQDVRIYKGVAKYTSNFVVPATFPDVLPDTPSGVSGGSKLTKITEGAVTFDGSNDHLDVGSAGDFNFLHDDTSSWTAEYFVYPRVANSRQAIFSTGGNSSATGFTNRIMEQGTGGSSNGYYVTAQISKGSGGNYLYWDSGSTKLNTDVWYHIALVFDNTDESLKIYVDGKLTNGDGTAHETGTFGSHSTSNSSYSLHIGEEPYNNALDLTAQVSNLRFINGVKLYTSDFTPPTAPLTNVTNTTLLCCQSPTSATAAAVTPGSITANGDAVATNFNPFITDINTVRGQETVYATLNPLFIKSQNSPSLSNGNLTYSHTQGIMLANTAYPKTGKWFFEVEMINTNAGLGIAIKDAPTNQYLGYDTNSWTYYSNSNATAGGKYTNYPSHNTVTSYGAGYTRGDIIGVALDRDTGELSYYKNGVYQGVAFTGFNDEKEYYPAVGSANLKVNLNFGQKPFKFPPPDGFQLLTAANLRPETVITRPDRYVAAMTYSGSSSSSNFVTDLKFNSKPDFVWIKSRSGSSSPGTQNHYLVDSVRGANGASGTSKLYSNDNDAVNGGQTSTTNGVRFIKNGFELTTDNDGTNDANEYVAWCWKAGGDKSTFNVDDVGYASASAAGLSCTADLVAASIGTKQGFSIIQYQATNGETVAHGLSEQPSFMMIKNMDSSGDWFAYHKNGNDGADMTNTNGLNLNNNDSTFNSGSSTFITATSATTFTVGSSSIVQNGSDDFIAYIWHDVPGVQKFGYYQGNGDASGPFVETGFRPVIVWYKDITSGGYWNIRDSARTTYNGTAQELYTATKEAENHHNNRNIDFLSNGFKIRNSHDAINNSSRKYIYMAWAETPTSNLYGAQSNAR